MSYSILVTAKGEYLLRSRNVDYGTYKTKEDAEAALKRVVENKIYNYNEKGIEI